MGDEHLDTIPEKESDEFIKSNVENLVPNPSESEDERECDVPVCYDFTTFSNLLFDADDNFSSSDDKLFSDEDDSDPSMEEINLFLTSDGPIPPGIDSDYSDFEGDNLFPERLLHDDPIPLLDILDFSNVVLIFPPLFTYPIEPDQGELTSVVIWAEPRVHMPNVLTTHPTLMLDLDFIPSDNSLPESKIFYFDIKEKNSGSTTIHADISLLDLECFNFKREPESDELTSIVDSRIRENILSATNVNLPPEDDHSPLSTYVVWIFLSFLTYLMVPPNLLSFGNEDTIFHPSISNYHFSSFMPGESNKSGTFMKFNVYQNHLNESPMEILSFTTFPKDQ
nr:hypothetical protein [Tanacetum cinerariifolium]